MDVLIKDMLMPKDCIFCPMAHWNKLDEITGCEIVIGKKYVDKTDRDFWYGDGRPKWCPLEESAERNGHWMQISPAKIYECSECGQNVMTNDIDCYKFCHGCGARMKGEDNG